MGAEPFPVSVPDDEARELLRNRLGEVGEGTAEYIVPRSTHPIVAPVMEELRRRPFEVRRETYVAGRTEDQQRWYAAKAEHNMRRATAWRVALVLAETTALMLAFLRLVGGWPGDFAGLLGALIASGAAWVAVKQHSPLASAYSTAARELLIQADRLRHVPDQHWARAASDAEAAISREHTLWTTSRTGRGSLA